MVESSTRESLYTIDDFARIGKSTVRNVRAYQEKGVLPPPIKHGRTGLYTDSHLARLRVIVQLLARGYSLANISELFDARDQGIGLNKLIGLDAALTSPWTEELPTYHSLETILSWFSIKPTAAEISEAIELRIFEPSEDGLMYIQNPRLIQIAVELTKFSIPIALLLRITRIMRTHFAQVAESLAHTAMDVLFSKNALGKRLDDGQIMAMIQTLNPLINTALKIEISSAVGNALSRRMTELVANEISHTE